MKNDLSKTLRKIIREEVGKAVRKEFNRFGAGNPSASTITSLLLNQVGLTEVTDRLSEAERVLFDVPQEVRDTFNDWWGETASKEITIDENSIIAPYALTNGETWFAFGAANSDGINHFKSFGTNSFGLEDVDGGGDKDYDDLIVKFDFNSVST